MMLPWENIRNSLWIKTDFNGSFTFQSCFMMLPWDDSNNSQGIEADLDDIFTCLSCL